VNVDLSAPENWRPSPTNDGGSPGVDDTLPPPAPVNFRATGFGDRVNLSWNAVNGAASYTIYRSETPGGEGATPRASGVTGTSYVDLTAAGGRTYYYQLSAINPGGEGARSAEASAQAYVPGDANDDLTVDFNDLVAVAQNYNTAGGKTWAQGDFTGDGKVDFNDLVILAQNYNTTRAPAGAAMSNSGPMPTMAEALAQVAATATPHALTPAPNPRPVANKPVRATRPPAPKPVANVPPEPVAAAKPAVRPPAKPVSKPAPSAPVPPPVFSTRKIAKARFQWGASPGLLQ
jgi:hypothetical protein